MAKKRKNTIKKKLVAKKGISKRKASGKTGGLKNELEDLAKILSGEMSLRMKEEELEKVKKEAIENQKDIRRKKVVKGKVRLVESGKDDVPVEKVVQRIKLFEWKAPIRYTFVFDAKYFLIIVGLSLLFILFLAILGHYGLMASIIALLFFIYVAGTVKPMNVSHAVTSRGIDTLDQLYEWFMLDDFWFSEKNNQQMLIVRTKLRVPHKLIMLLDKKDRTSIFVLLQDKLLYRDIRKQGWLEELTYGDYIPLEKV